MTHTFKYLSKIALVALALIITHSPSFAQEDLKAKLKDYCKWSSDLLEGAKKQQSYKRTMHDSIGFIDDNTTGSWLRMLKDSMTRGMEDLEDHWVKLYHIHEASVLFDLSGMGDTLKEINAACKKAGY
jgi:hypothetical protein